MSEAAPAKHDWMFDGRVMFCRKCFQKTSAPGRDGSEMDTECKGLGEIHIVPLSRAEIMKGDDDA